MRILQIVNPVVPIPPVTMGGTERIVHALVSDLVHRGHDITLLAEDTSVPPAGVVFEGIGSYWHQERTTRRVWSYLVRHGRRFDVIHNHGRLLFHLPRLWSRTAKVHTFHFGDLLVSNIRNFLSLRPRHFAFAPCGNWIAQKYSHLGGAWHTVHNGLALDVYVPSFEVAHDAPFVIIGRMDPRKGIPEAIRIARAVGRRLLIAGVVGDQPHEKEWFEQNVMKLCDGCQIVFIGPVNEAEKQELFGRAAALLLPIQASEAFTVVMIEALAAGCPVVGLDRFCLPELIRDGKNGLLADTEADLIEKLRSGHLARISRGDCRRDFEERFSAPVMTGHYIRLYEDLLSGV